MSRIKIQYLSIYVHVEYLNSFLKLRSILDENYQQKIDSTRSKYCTKYINDRSQE